jgi:hypothetical protein
MLLPLLYTTVAAKGMASTATDEQELEDDVLDEKFDQADDSIVEDDLRMILPM